MSWRQRRCDPLHACFRPTVQATPHGCLVTGTTSAPWRRPAGQQLVCSEDREAPTDQKSSVTFLCPHRQEHKKHFAMCRLLRVVAFPPDSPPIQKEVALFCSHPTWSSDGKLGFQLSRALGHMRAWRRPSADVALDRLRWVWLLASSPSGPLPAVSMSGKPEKGSSWSWGVRTMCGRAELCQPAAD